MSGWQEPADDQATPSRLSGPRRLSEASLQDAFAVVEARRRGGMIAQIRVNQHGLATQATVKVEAIRRALVGGNRCDEVWQVIRSNEARLPPNELGVVNAPRDVQVVFPEPGLVQHRVRI